MFSSIMKKASPVFATVACALATPALAATCPADFPDGPIALKVGFSAGGGTDSVARKAASLLQQQQGWTVYVENHPGASGGVMAKGLLKADSKGLSIGVGSTTTLAINPYKSKDINYTYQDFNYMGTGMMLNYGLTTKSGKPYSNLEEFVEYARDKGRATVSVGSLSYEIAVRNIAKHYGVRLIPIPTKGSSRALKDALGGHVDATVQGTAHVSQIRAGKMVQLATLTSERATYAPETKTLIENGLDLAIDGHIIFFTPKHTDSQIQTCLTEALAEVTESSEYTDMMNKLQAAASNLGAEGTTSYLQATSKFYQEALAK
ncbi:tripartite tricarboxylate transporter substrate binding protein [Marinomonas balearica]|uniref:Tripartite-type tricarboxylate transporter receptor subunit TctC n=1 Tax=Marinomonas balearica TaxID=491947 RepID=A0A4R6MH05_9GAMM|nr:tripartite tricarboxylate transporter substrate binding protein [Marinomonas balearica]TDP01208.1 tripartite-type tricarboxylate transporter receptor subunit TctC [Marinomonas balearica]